MQHAKERKHEAEAAAKSARDENLRYDQVWCVFDIDEHPNVPAARQMAYANGIHLAISNAAFELWLILHFRENPGPQHRKHLVRILKQFIPSYDKNLDFASVGDGYARAVERARHLDEGAAAMGNPGCNPTTGVWRLTEAIRERDDEPPPDDDGVQP